MRPFSACCLALAMGGAALLAPAQVDPLDQLGIIAPQLEEWAAEEETDPEILAEEILDLLENPVQVNSATPEELERLFVLTPFQRRSLYDHIARHGPLLTPYELAQVYGFDSTLIGQLLPFISLSNDTRRGPSLRGLRHGRHSLMVRSRSLIETPRGYTPRPPGQPGATRYAGSRVGLYTRYRFRTPNGLQLGFVGEKDPGEEFLRGSNPQGFDHMSFHAQLKGQGHLQTLVLGDFHAEFGQGLTLWSGWSMGPSADPLAHRKRPRGLRGSSSTEENRYLRGAGVAFRFGRVTLSGFGSYKRIDANLSDTLPDGTLTFTSTPTGGLHRTPSELANRNTLPEMVAGGNASLALDRLRVGTTLSIVRLMGQHRPRHEPYRYFEPPQGEQTNLGVDVKYALRNHLLYGEAAHTLGHGSGALAGALLRLHPQLHLSLHGRNYQRNFSTRYTGALAEGAAPANERGFLAGFLLKPYKFWELRGLADHFASSWLRFGVNAPSRGNAYLLEARYTPRSGLSFSIRYRNKHQESNVTPDTTQARWVAPFQRQSLRFHISAQPLGSLELRSRIELAWYSAQHLPTERGLMVYQDMIYRPAAIPLMLSARFAIFDTDSWNTRIHAYEHDVLYAFSVPAYYWQGTRIYLLARYSLSASVDIWIRFAQTYFANRTEIGSGLDQIGGPSRSEAKVQLRVQL